jgi:hypothetical protein
LLPVPKQPGLKAGAFSRALLVPVAATGINGLYKPGLKAFFPPVFIPHFLHLLRKIPMQYTLIQLFSTTKTAGSPHTRVPWVVAFAFVIVSYTASPKYYM